MTVMDRARPSADERPERSQRQRSASHLSDRQIANAAWRGRKVTVRFLSVQPAHEVVGYVVGSDSYHWMLAAPVAHPESGEEPIAITLIHKGLAPLVQIHQTSTLESEEPAVREALTQVGSAFWAHCKNASTGH